MNKVWSVELEAADFADDTFNGTLEECFAYIVGNGYKIDHIMSDDAENNDVCQLAYVELDDHGCVCDCIYIINDPDEVTNMLHGKIPVEYKAGEPLHLDCDSVDYMWAKIGDDAWGDAIVLYAEVDREDYPGETDSYEDLKKMILSQAEEMNINPEILRFWYDD